MEILSTSLHDQNHQPEPHSSRWWDVLFILVMILGAYFRLVGVNWDANQHLHPDERFLTMVESGISPVNSLAEYFDTNQSSLNPQNKGFGFYVYGTLPIFIVRYVAEWTNQTGYDQVFLVGRYISALIDLLTAFFVFLAAKRLYQDSRIGFLAGAFYALAVLPIQLSHFFTVDTFLGFFGFLSFYFAVLVMTAVPKGLPGRPIEPAEEAAIIPEPQAGAMVFQEVEEAPEQEGIAAYLGRAWGSLIPYLFFGIALGLAMSSKVSAAPLAILLPGAALIFWSKIPKEQQEGWFIIILRNLVIAAVVAFLVFRIFQPYAFSGPGFFGIKPNPKWVDNMKELSSQSTGDVDFPPALQWARRPIYFAWENMVKWGLGLPLGLLAWGGFLWMGWRILKGEWRQHALLWSWTLLYFSWQEINFTRSMRYQILVYPTLAMIAGWTIVALWNRHWQNERETAGSAFKRLPWSKIVAAALGVIVLVGTAGWAYSFTRIYTRPMTRVAASQWIYQNVPGPINLHIQTKDGEVNQPISFRAGYPLNGSQKWVLEFKSQSDSTLVNVEFTHIVDSQLDPNPKNLQVSLLESRDAQNPLSYGILSDPFLPDENDARGKAYQVALETPVQLRANHVYYLVMSLQDQGTSSLSFGGILTLNLIGSMGPIQQILPETVDALQDGKDSYSIPFTPIQDGSLNEVTLDRVVDWSGSPDPKTLMVSVGDQPTGGSDPVVQGQLLSSFQATNDPRGQSYIIKLQQPVSIKQNSTYYLTLTKANGPGEIALYGSKTAIESTWDDPLPLPMDGFSPFDLNNGIYRTDLNFEMYWDDNADKLQRFTSIFDQADYIFISSNRQWGTTVRVPERYPLTTYTYRNLIGCPETQSIITCYADAKPGMYQGKLGFDLVQIFQSNPNIGPIQFNTQYAEEAFTVYDAPKVLIFKKRADFDPAKVQAMLSGVDLTYVVHVTPRKAGSYPANLLLPMATWIKQQAGGTWSQLFNREALYNQYPGLGLVLWYLTISLLGWMVYPFVRLALRSLPDKGYPFTKLIGMLLLAYFTWVAGSSGIPVTKTVITGVALCLLAGGLFLGWVQRDSLRQEWQQRKRYFLMIEGLALAFFAVDLLIRLGNPDLWHPYKGGEKPMDFSFFNAILKSTTFPPYDPWFANGYINYYYFGFVIAGVPVKWLGIIPSIAYNLVLPTFFSLLAMGAFSFAWNIFSVWRTPASLENENDDRTFMGVRMIPLLAGLAAAVGLLILGNEGTVRMIWHGVMKLVAPGGNLDGSNLLMKLSWTLQGLIKYIGGARLPYAPGDWYWIPSRAIPGEPITEFPFFTFLYGDPHAHLFAYPLTILALSWALSIVLGKWCWADEKGRLAWLHFGGSFLLGGLVIGSLRPVNTWDLPTYLAIGIVAIAYTAYRYGGKFLGTFLNLPQGVHQTISVVASIALLAGLSFMLYLPYAQWYAQGYNSLKLWDGDHTPFWSYMTHWALFLFVIVSWLFWETRDWLATTPVSALRKLKPYQLLIEGLVILLVIGVMVLTILLKVQIAWLALPLAAWAAVLILRPGQPDIKRFVLFMIGSGITLTLAVEVIVLVGDIGRMNTVFKFYLQAWTLLSLSAAAALFWLWPAVSRVWISSWRNGWSISLGLLVFGAFLFPLMGGTDKITDRMAKDAPHTLDGMAYMPYATYADHDKTMQLSQDYQAILWMQANIQGSPVIAEANQFDLYRWGNRFTIYSGLPDVVGWDWHERQQRAVTPGEWVTNRVNEIADFYTTPDQNATVNFLRKYNVRYIVVGQLEEAIYNGPGLSKFSDWNGKLWKQVYHQGETTIYEVIE